MKDIPENSQIKADMLLSMTTITQKFAPNIDSQWGNYGAQAFLLLKTNTKACSPGKIPGLPGKTKWNGNEEDPDVSHFIS